MLDLRLPGLTLHAPAGVAAAYHDLVEDWARREGGRRLWRGDASLWTDEDEARWLGWLDPAARIDLEALRGLRARAEAGHWARVALLGMGGSSLGAEVLASLVPSGTALPLHVVDTTDPEEIGVLRSALDPESTLFVVASKSGTTLETVCLEALFWAAVQETGDARTADRFLAITDTGTPLDTRARERGYSVLRGAGDVGGRFSVLTAFGLGPAAASGGDIEAVLAGVERARVRAQPNGEGDDNRAVALGLALVALERCGLDKLRLRPPEGDRCLADWLEQLIAESTGKDGRGLLPIAADRVVPSAGWGPDQVLVSWRGGAGAEEAPAEVARLVLDEATGFDLGTELFDWELATAVASVFLGVNPFVQPDVESAKQASSRVLEDPAGAWSAEEGCRFEDSSWRWFGGRHAADPEALLQELLGSVREGDYVGVLAFLPRFPDVIESLERLREVLVAGLGCAVSLGMGPRYLHSTGQLFKGGPDTGVFLVLAHPSDQIVPVPGHAFDFGELERAQAWGDYAVLRERGRRVLAVDLLRDDLADAVDRLTARVASALA